MSLYQVSSKVIFLQNFSTMSQDTDIDTVKKIQNISVITMFLMTPFYSRTYFPSALIPSLTPGHH